jgi:hypothetical protein
MSWKSNMRHVQPIRAGASGQLAIGDEMSLPVNVVEGGEDILLVLLADPGEALARPTGGLMLESGTSRSLVRMRGTAVRLEGDLVRFTVDGPPQIVQRRQFVRVIAPQPVTLDDDDGWVSDTRSLNISGGGMLVSGPAALDLDREIRFAISLGEDHAPVTGLGRVVRAASDQQRAIVFEQIRQGDRERLIHFIFDRQRAALAITRGDTV